MITGELRAFLDTFIFAILPIHGVSNLGSLLRGGGEGGGGGGGRVSLSERSFMEAYVVFCWKKTPIFFSFFR
jgi:hypothetical protein